MSAIQNNRAQKANADMDVSGYWLEKASSACSDDDVATGVDCCHKALSVDHGNEKALVMLAEYAGWDPKLRTLDLETSVKAIRRALKATSEEEAALVATDVYRIRKDQIGLMLEADSMMPSYESAKRVHETMVSWLRLLEEMPELGCGIVEHEIAQCESLCAQSRKSIAPSDRLVYVAFASFNCKESYGAMFRRALDKRIVEGRKFEGELKTGVLERAMRRRIAYQAWMDCEQPKLEAQRARLLEDAASLKSDIQTIAGLADTRYYERQIRELKQQFSALKELNLMKKHRIKSQIDYLNGKIDRIENEFAPILETLREDAARIRRLGSEIDHALANE